MLSVSLVALALASVALTSPVERVSKTGPSVQGFEALRAAPPTDTVSMLFALPASDTTGMRAALMDVSDPASPKYGKYLSKEEVEAFAAPKPESVNAVKTWLAQHGVTPEVASPSGDMLRVHIPVQKANALLNANYTQYLHKNSNTSILATLSYSVPPDVKEHVSFIYPTDQFIPPATGGPSSSKVIPPGSLHEDVAGKPTSDAIPATCDQLITPACLQAIYNIPSAPATAESNSIFVPAFVNEFATEADLNEFREALRPDLKEATFSVVSIDGGRTSGTGTLGCEFYQRRRVELELPVLTVLVTLLQSLDIQYTAGLATGVPVQLASVGSSTVQGFIDMNNYLLGRSDPPKVVTVSYGTTESGFSTDIADKLCDAYVQLGLRGTTVMYASGDGGVGGTRYNDYCYEFVPTFPSGCPYITLVGATTGHTPEVAADLSSGGFSDLFSRPTYQQDAVAQYLTVLGDEYEGLFNPNGRAYPDVAAQGTDFVIVADGQYVGVDGTSASSPTIASIVALVNDERLNAGKSSLGFLNPLLYSDAAAPIFNDITAGSNPGCSTNGFPAKSGWDPVTGLGSVDYERLAQVARELP